MNNQIIIKRFRDKERDYIASYYHEFLRCNYSVYFKDNVFGAVALNHFVEMIQKVFDKDVCVTVIDDGIIKQNSPFRENLQPRTNNLVRDKESA
jgi:hypothetical protein